MGRLLVSRVLVGIGLVSYSAHLWHKPLLSFARHRSLTEPNDFVVASLVVLTFGLAYLTWRYVEMPFRQKEIVTKSGLWKFALVLSVVVAVSTASLQLISSDPRSAIVSNMEKLYRLRTCFLSKARLLKRFCRINVTWSKVHLFSGIRNNPGLLSDMYCMETVSLLKRGSLSGNTQWVWSAV